MRLPDFLIIGAQKCGSTWLNAMLRQHPTVYSPGCEVHFFDKDANYARGVEWYASHFDGVTTETVIGEKTPDYLWADARGAEGHSPDVHRRIHATLPEARLLVTLRDPVERAVSAVNHLIRSGRISPLPRLDRYLVGDRRDEVAAHGVLDKGRYRRQLEAYLELFDSDRLLILIFEEEIRADPHRGLRRACEFLRIDPGFPFHGVGEPVNRLRRSRPGLAVAHHLPPLRGVGRWLDRVAPPWKGRPSGETVAGLRELFREENERLFELLGRRIPAWEDR